MVFARKSMKLCNQARCLVIEVGNLESSTQEMLKTKESKGLCCFIVIRFLLKNPFHIS